MQSHDLRAYNWLRFAGECKHSAYCREHPTRENSPVRPIMQLKRRAREEKKEASFVRGNRGPIGG